MYIHEHKEWPSFSWDKELVGEKLNEVNKAVGYLTGRLSVIGFNDKMSAVVESISHDIIASSEIEGVELNNEQVRSSVARKLGVQTAKNWAKRIKVSPDTAARDIKDLVEKGILVPQQGRVRDVFYGIRCSESVLVIPMPEDL